MLENTISSSKYYFPLSLSTNVCVIDEQSLWVVWCYNYVLSAPKSACRFGNAIPTYT